MRSVWLAILLGLIVLGCRPQNGAKPVAKPVPSRQTTPLVDQPTSVEKPSADLASESVVLFDADGMPCDSLGMPLVFEYELPEIPEHLVGPTLESPGALSSRSKESLP